MPWILEDLGHETVGNLPVAPLDALLAESNEASLAVGIDARTHRLDVPALDTVLGELRARPNLDLWMVLVTTDAEVLLRRFSEMQHRHPLVPGDGSPGLPSEVAEGIAREDELVAPLRDAADWFLDTSDLLLPEPRRQVEHSFQVGSRRNEGIARPSRRNSLPSRPDCLGMRA